MTNLFVKESWVEVTKTEDDNEERRLGLGESDVYETFTDNRGDLYRSLQKTYGRCTSKVYNDVNGKEPKEIGWVFVRREKQTDCNDSYLQETWVTVHTQLPTKTIKYHYA